MGLFRRRRADPEERAEGTNQPMVTGEEALIRALIGDMEITKDIALAIPSVASSIERIAETVASLPLKLYKREQDGSIVEILDDDRLFLLNHNTGDKLTANQFWKAIIQDYFLGKGGYAYINKRGTKYDSIHYVDEKYVSVTEFVDPIYKTSSIYVNGKVYQDYELLKILRNTKNGVSGTSVVSQHKLALSVAYYSFVYEDSMLRKGGNKKGFLTSEKQLDEPGMELLKNAFKNLYSNNSEEKIVVLNKGLEFKESSNTAVEMQLNENKKDNVPQISMIFKVPASILNGTATEKDIENYVSYAVMPVITEIESSLDRDMLTFKEAAEGYYWAFDTKELTRGSVKERYEAYKIGLEKNFLQIDEVRKQEDLPDLGFKWITLGLNSVLLNPETMEIYTPNTGQWQKLNKSQIQSMKGDENNED